jgi:hypothetical protein
MLLLTWLHRRKSGEQSVSTRIRPRARRHSFRPVLEALEPRWVPTAIVEIQSIGKAASPAMSSLHIPVASGAAAGDSIIVELAVNNGGVAYSTLVTDTAGNTYIHDDVVSGQGIESDMFSSTGINAIPAGGQITITFNAAVKAAAATAQEFYGLQANMPTDSTTTTMTGLGSGASAFNGIKTFTANDLVVSASAVLADPSNTFTALSGSIAAPGAGVTAFNGGPFIDIDPAYKFAGALGNYTAGVQLFKTVTASDTSISAYSRDTTTHFKVTPTVTSVAANTVFSVVVQALDISSAPDLGYTGRVHFTSSDAFAGLPADYTFTPADNGVHIFRNVTLATLNSQTITATDTIDSSVVGQATVVATPVGYHFVISAPASAQTHVQFPITVTAVDASNHVLLGYNGTVHFTSSDSTAILPANYTFTVGTGGDNGVHTFNNLILRAAGPDTITATSTVFSITGTTTVMALSTLASALSVTGFPSATTAGVAHGFTVIARDSLGNRERGFVGTVQFMSSDAHAALPVKYTFTTADQGMHVFAATFRTAGSQWLAAALSTSPSVGGRQSAIVVSAVPVATLSSVSPVVAAPLSYSPELRTLSTTAAADGLVPGGHSWDFGVTYRRSDSSLASDGLGVRRGADAGSGGSAIADLMTTVLDALFAHAQ